MLTAKHCNIGWTHIQGWKQNKPFLQTVSLGSGPVLQLARIWL